MTRLSTALIQPMAAADVVDAVVDAASGPPLEGIRNIAGPDIFHLDELGRMTLAAQHDNRPVVTDDHAGMFAAATGNVLTAGPDARLAPTHYQDWLQTATRLPGVRGPARRPPPEERVEPGLAPMGEVDGQQLPAITGHLVHVDRQGFRVVRTLSAEVLELRHAPRLAPPLALPNPRMDVATL